MKRPLLFLGAFFVALWLLGYIVKGAVPFGFWKPSDGIALHPTLNISNVGYWKLDETSGTRADSSGHANLITLTAQTNAIGFSNGVVGNGANFVTASNTYFSSGADATNFSMGDIDFSVSAWVKVNALTGTGQHIVSHYLSAGNQRGWSMYVDGASGKFSFIVTSNGATITASVQASAAAQAGKWYHVVAGHNSTSNHLFIVTNNVSMTPVTHTTGVHDGTGPLALGAIANPTDYLGGTIDEVGIWKKVLSPSEIADLFATNRTCCPFTP